MSYNLETTTKYLKDAKRAKQRGLDMDELISVVGLLVAEEPLLPKYKDHALIGNYKGCRELHINPDWLLIYRKDTKIKLITLVRTGTHSDLF